ncbi:BEM_collapsed_G0016530.mRNA.1.CDS.1 [Saccharomyces cerevisiae]|nr:BEM_collapsed_G0016530.mRNA.1.CDS.1 [Saccharomyces cerevisiae]
MNKEPVYCSSPLVLLVYLSTGLKDLQGSDGPRRFTIEKAGEVQQLPKSHTCSNRVDFATIR